jgi:hypothetical protein
MAKPVIEIEVRDADDVPLRAGAVWLDALMQGGIGGTITRKGLMDRLFEELHAEDATSVVLTLGERDE